MTRVKREFADSLIIIIIFIIMTVIFIIKLIN